MNEKTVFQLLLLFFLTSCDSIPVNDIKPTEQKSQLDDQFINGFQMELVQVYVMDGRAQTIPALNNPIESLFRGTQYIVNLPNYNTLCWQGGQPVLYGLTPNEMWTIHPIVIVSDTVFWEQGWGSNRQVVRSIIHTPYTFITSSNQFTQREFLTNVRIGNIYNQRGRDNHNMRMFYYSTREEDYVHTNLVLTVLVDDIFKSFDGNYLYLNSNRQTNMSQLITAPLTSNQVREQIALGNYELYMRNGMVFFRIGENLYRPSFGDNFIFAGSTSQSGMISGIATVYYRLRFRIL